MVSDASAETMRFSSETKAGNAWTTVPVSVGEGRSHIVRPLRPGSFP